MEVLDYSVTKPSNFKYINNMEALSPLEFPDHFSLYIPLHFTECHNEESEQLTDKLFWDKKKTISKLFLRVLGMGYVILLWHSLSLLYNYYDDLNDKRQRFEDSFSHVVDKISDKNG